MPFERETFLKCPLCECEKLEAWHSAADRLLNRSQIRFSYVTCEGCGLYFQSAPPARHGIAWWYEGDYGPYGKTRAPASTFPAKVKRWTSRRLGRFATISSGLSGAGREIRASYKAKLTPGSCFLDYGCGDGSFLDEARRRWPGIQTMGYDLAKEMLAKVAAKGHTVLMEGDGVEEIPDGTLDFVRMSHVVEHLYDPVVVLRTVNRKLKAGGILHVSTPDPEGPSARRFGADWFSLDAPRHIMLFTPDRLTRLLMNAGFSAVKCRLEPSIHDWMRSAQRSRNESESWEQDGHLADILSSVAHVRRAAALGHADRYSILAVK